MNAELNEILEFVDRTLFKDIITKVIPVYLLGELVIKPLNAAHPAHGLPILHEWELIAHLYLAWTLARWSGLAMERALGALHAFLDVSDQPGGDADGYD